MKIVIAVDGSQYGKWAVQWAGRLRLAGAPRVTALHVVDVAALRGPFVAQPVVAGSEPFLRREIQRLQNQAREVSAETKAALASLGLEGTVKVEQGPVADTILRHVRGRRDLVVMGHRGLTALDRFMLGSVSTQVTLHAPCSVLVVKQPPRAIRRVLLATDGSKASERALQFLCRELRPREAAPNVPTEDIEVTVVHVLPFLKYPELKEAGKALTACAADRVERAGFRVREALRLGRPADQIMAVAKTDKSDLIVAGAKGLGAVARFFLGSVSTKLVQHSRCSVLVVR
jgi:nucleotide-binding universal stress UspA family protein